MFMHHMGPGGMGHRGMGPMGSRGMGPMGHRGMGFGFGGMRPPPPPRRGCGGPMGCGCCLPMLLVALFVLALCGCRF